MKTRKINLKAVFPNGQTHHGEYTVWGDTSSREYYRHFAERAARECNIEAKRGESNQITVNVSTLEIDKGFLVETKKSDVIATIYYERLKEDQFNEDMNELLKDIPKQFYPFISGYSWEQGHSSGFEEVLTIARNLVSGLEIPIKLAKECKC